MKLITSAFNWLAGTHNTGLNTNTDQLTDTYRELLSRARVPSTYTSKEVQQAARESGIIEAQVSLAKVWHGHRQKTIKGLDELDSLTTKTATLFSDTAERISDRRSEAQETILLNEAKVQVVNSRLNALKGAYAEGLKISGLH